MTKFQNIATHLFLDMCGPIGLILNHTIGPSRSALTNLVAPLQGLSLLVSQSFLEMLANEHRSFCLQHVCSFLALSNSPIPNDLESMNYLIISNTQCLLAPQFLRWMFCLNSSEKLMIINRPLIKQPLPHSLSFWVFLFSSILNCIWDNVHYTNVYSIFHHLYSLVKLDCMGRGGLFLLFSLVFWRKPHSQFFCGTLGVCFIYCNLRMHYYISPSEMWS